MYLTVVGSSLDVIGTHLLSDGNLMLIFQQTESLIWVLDGGLIIRATEKKSTLL